MAGRGTDNAVEAAYLVGRADQDVHGSGVAEVDEATSDADITNILKKLCERIAQAIQIEIGSSLEYANRWGGSTFSIAWKIDHSRYVTAFVGDSLIYAVETDNNGNKKVRNLTPTSHHVSHIDAETKRFIESQGGEIQKGYMYNKKKQGIAVYRSFGDLEWQGLISPTPTVVLHTINANMQDTVIMVMSDGIIDCLTEVAQKDKKPPKQYIEQHFISNVDSMSNLLQKGKILAEIYLKYSNVDIDDATVIKFSMQTARPGQFIYVCDGHGGCQEGKKLSNHCATNIKQWIDNGNLLQDCVKECLLQQPQHLSTSADESTPFFHKTTKSATSNEQPYDVVSS